MGTGSFPGVKQPGRGVDDLPPSNAEVKERIELYLCSLSGSLWPILGRTLFILCVSIDVYKKIKIFTLCKFLVNYKINT